MNFVFERATFKRQWLNTVAKLQTENSDTMWLTVCVAYKNKSIISWYCCYNADSAILVASKYLD